jgi:thymidylate synthase (FAD)
MFETVTPPALIDGDSGISHVLEDLTSTARAAYDYLVSRLVNNGLSRKAAREAARCVLPNMTETKIVVTGNMRAWRHFISLRATTAADAEICEFAVEILKLLWGVAPNCFGDYAIEEIAGRQVAHTNNHET